MKPQTSTTDLPRDTREPSSIGTGPDRKLLEIVRFWIPVKVTISGGRNPENVLPDKSRTSVGEEK